MDKKSKRYSALRLPQKITLCIEKDAERRLKEFQEVLRAEGYQDAVTMPGNLVSKLILTDDALQHLKKEYSKKKI